MSTKHDERAEEDYDAHRKRAIAKEERLAKVKKHVGEDTLKKVKGLAERLQVIELAQLERAQDREPAAIELRRAVKVSDELERRQVKRLADASERPVVEPPEILTLERRLQRPVEEIPWRISRWLPLGCRAILAAQAKTGKTTFVQNMIRCLADGTSFLDVDRVSPLEGTVVLLDFEMGARQMDSWFRDQKIEHPERVVPIPLRGSAASFDIRIPEVRAGWCEQLRQLGAEFLIIDCLRPILDALGVNEHNEAGLFLTAIDALLKEASISECVVVHHMGHNGERSRGDSRLRDWPDVEWRLMRDKAGEDDGDVDPSSQRFVSAFGRDVDVPESALTFDPTTRRLQIIGGSRADQKVLAALQAVLVQIDQAGAPMSGSAIEKALKGSDHARATVRRALDMGVRTRDLVRASGGQGGGALFSRGEGRHEGESRHDVQF